MLLKIMFPKKMFFWKKNVTINNVFRKSGKFSINITFIKFKILRFYQVETVYSNSDHKLIINSR
jgi:hypothetical protein